MDLAERCNGALRRLPPWTLYPAGLGWAAWLFWLALTGGLGVEPINALEREYGEKALWLLVAGLAVTPLRTWTGLNLLRFRRAIGVTAFGFVLAHVLVFAVLDVQSLARVWEEVVKRPYVTAGALAFLLLLPLAATSNNLSVRRLGAAAWRRLHRLVYPAVLLGAVHYLWLAKGFQLEPILWTAAIAGLLVLRLVPARRRSAVRGA